MRRTDVNLRLHTARLIAEVRRREALWNAACPEFREHQLKRRKWDEICVIFRKRYNEMDARDRADIKRAIQGKWKNIKDCYRKYIKHKQKSIESGEKTTEKEYLYAENLKFLDRTFKNLSAAHSDVNADPPHMVIKEEDVEADWEMTIESSDEAEDDLLDEGDLMDGEQSWSWSDHGHDQRSNAHHYRSDQQDQQGRNGQDESDHPMWEHRLLGENTAEPPRKKISLDGVNKGPSASTETVHKFSGLEENDDMNFFLSLMPALRTLPLEDKIKYRMDVMQTTLDYHRRWKRRPPDLNVRFLVVPEASATPLDSSSGPNGRSSSGSAPVNSNPTNSNR